MAPLSQAPGRLAALSTAAMQAVDDNEGIAFQLLGNDDRGSDEGMELSLEPVAMTSGDDSPVDVEVTGAGVAPHALGPQSISARGSAEVRRGPSSPPAPHAKPSLGARGKRRGRSASLLTVDLGRFGKLLLVAAAWVVVWLVMRDDTISVETEVGTHTFKYVHRLSEAAQGDAELPLIVALHGNGDTPGDFYESLLEDFEEPARFVLFRAPREVPDGRFFGTAWPHGPTAIERYGERLMRAIELLPEKYPTQCKPILLGFSGGAHIAYYLAANHAGDFSMIVPVAGRLHPDLVPGRRPWDGDGAPIRIFHGRQDTTVGFRLGQEATDALLKLGADVSLQPLEGGHQAVFAVGRYRVLELLQGAASSCK